MKVSLYPVNGLFFILVVGSFLVSNKSHAMMSALRDGYGYTPKIQQNELKQKYEEFEGYKVNKLPTKIIFDLKMNLKNVVRCGLHNRLDAAGNRITEKDTSSHMLSEELQSKAVSSDLERHQYAYINGSKGSESEGFNKVIKETNAKDPYQSPYYNDKKIDACDAKILSVGVLSNLLLGKGGGCPVQDVLSDREITSGLERSQVKDVKRYTEKIGEFRGVLIEGKENKTAKDFILELDIKS